MVFTSCGNTNTPDDKKTNDSTLTATKDSTATKPEDKSKRESPPKEDAFDINGVKVSVVWGAPKVKDRVIWGNLVPYGEVWRTGANEATTIEFDKDAKVNGKAIPAGKYSLFSIPDKKQWTIIFNTVPDQWGAFEYEKDKDQLRITSKPETAEMTESMDIISVDNKIYIVWEKLKVGFTVEAK